MTTLAVSEGQAVKPGDVLLTLEAMKMEAAIYADHAGTIARIVAPVGSQVEAKDLPLSLMTWG